jgi:long-chain acyl-CoA synthetase
MKSIKPFKRIIRAIRKTRVSIFVGIYNILKDIKLPRIFNTSLIRLFNPVKICISGAAALPAQTLKGFEKKFRIPLLEGYGLTEASPVITLNPLKEVRKPGSIGIALSKNIELKIVNGKDTVLGHGKIGELLVKWPNVMQGYYKQQEATQQVLKDGKSASEHEIIQYLKDRLASFKIPKYIEFRASLPKNTSGKILKRALA